MKFAYKINTNYKSISQSQLYIYN